MSEPRTHSDGNHVHGPSCGHQGVRHNGHIDYLHDGHLHHPTADGVEEHSLEVGTANPMVCTADQVAAGHDAAHRHGPDCGHEAIPHGEHVDYLVGGRLHQPHGGHCDDHGSVALA